MSRTPGEEAKRALKWALNTGACVRAKNGSKKCPEVSFSVPILSPSVQKVSRDKIGTESGQTGTEKDKHAGSL